MFKRSYFNAFLGLSLVLLLSSTAIAGELDRFSGLKGTIDIAGGTAHIPVMKDAAKSIMSKYPGISITVAGGGSGVGVQKVGEGLVDIGNAGRPVSEKELAKYPKLVSFPFAIDGVAPVVNPSNPVQTLSSEQLKAIFAGEISNWKSVGGADAQIHLFSRDEASGTRSVFWKKALGKSAISEAANIVASNGAMKVAISRDPHALGYMSIGHLDESIKSVSLDGVAASQENAINGSYPVIRKLFMNTNGTPEPLVDAFIQYVLSSSESIRSRGYIPLEN